MKPMPSIHNPFFDPVFHIAALYKYCEVVTVLLNVQTSNLKVLETGLNEISCYPTYVEILIEKYRGCNIDRSVGIYDLLHKRGNQCHLVAYL
jgi:hypothetical protein